MAYYAPPGGQFTAKVARELQESSMQGLGIVPSINVRTPRAIPAAIGAARRMRNIAPSEESTMTGMGIVTTPATHARRFAVPAPIMFSAAQTATARRAALTGLGVAAARRPIGVRPFVITQAFPSAAGVQRQAAMYMSPGGGYSQIPGFMPAIGPPMKRLAWLALGQDETITFPAPEPTTIPAPDILVPPPDIFVPRPITGLLPSIPPPVPVETTMIPAPTSLKLPSTGTPLALQNVPLPNLLPGQLYAAVPGATVKVSQPFMNASTLGVPNKYLIAGAFAVVILTAIGGRRRRNPHRRRNRAR